MFNLVVRNLSFSFFKSTLVLRLFPRSLCSSSAASQNSFTSFYLIESCGFPPDKAISVSKYLNIKTPDRADSVITFLKNQGFTDTQICHLVQKLPAALTYNPEKNLLPKFQFLISTGFSASDIAKLLSANPKPLGRSLKNHIEPAFNLLRDLLQSNDRTLVAIKHYPWYLGFDYHAKLAPNIQLLQDVGVPRSNMLYVLTYLGKDFVGSTDRFKMVVDEVVEMVFDPLKLNFMLAVSVIRSMSKSTWEKKMETYEKWGWSKDQILEAFRTYPWCMKTSEKKINKMLDFYVNKMGFETSIVLKNVMILAYSVEKRIIPRCLVYKYCLENGLVEDKNYGGLIWWLKCKENIFIKKLEKYETIAPGVLKFYQEKLDHGKESAKSRHFSLNPQVSDLSQS
ncbi:hypothetical protein LXL04_018380 [Taraxacum kok-saghyz]